MSLAPPVEPMLARAVPRLPEPAALPGGTVLEPKYDGFRLLVFAGADGDVFLQSRNGSDLTRAFPEIADAAAALGEDVVIDGEAVIYMGGKLDFSALQQRMNRRPRTVALLAREQPAHLAAFDLLQHAGTEMLAWPYAERRAALESLFQGHGQAPWALTPSTTDRVLARQWLAEWTAVGVEGLVIKGLSQTYQPGRRGWLKYRTRSTAEAVIGAVTGSLIRPETVLLGRYTSDGRFLLVARSTPLGPRLRAELGGGLLAPAGADHPWHDVHFTSHWGCREPLTFTPVAPQLVAEFQGDTAVDRGRWRHPVNLHRLRIDIAPDDIPPYGTEGSSADPDRGQPAAQ
jgi:ATP-dependent DNA ligase